MTIKSIFEIKNKKFPKLQPIKEIQQIRIPKLIDDIPNRNGFIWVLSGSGGSGKSNCYLNFFRSNQLYRGKFHNIYFFCPMSSFLSVEKHPLEKLENIYHDLTVQNLEYVFKDLNSKKADYLQSVEKQKKRKMSKREIFLFDDDDYEEEEEEEERELQYSICIIDDFADALKDIDIQKQLSKMLIKSRHLCCAFVFTLQSYFYFPKILRKQITNITIFKPKNAEEWNTIAKELLNLNQDDGLILYNYVFNEPYSHLDIDTLTNELFKNFNKLEIEN